MSTCTGVPAGRFVGASNAEADRNRRRAGLDGGRTRDDLQRDLRSPAATAARRARAPITTRGDVGERHRRDDFEPLRIDDAQHRIAGGGFDEIAGVVIPLRDDAVEGRAHDRARGDRLAAAARAPRPARAPPARRRPRDRRLRLPCAPRRRARTDRARASGWPWRWRAPPARAATSAACFCDFGRCARNLEADEHVAALDAIAFAVRESPRCAPARARRRSARRPAPE